MPYNLKNLKTFKRAKRKNGKFLLDKFKSNYKFIDEGISIKAPVTWNKLPTYLRKIRDKLEFTIALTKYLWEDQLATQ